MVSRLRARGVDALYEHQVAGIDALRDGRSVVVATGTASGKSLCYQVPIVSSVLENRRDTALLIFPTKALAQDQLRSLRSYLVPGLRAVTYDGDTASDDRAWARKNANVILTNPEMLHMGILPSHKRWATFLMRLRYVVVDELHTLRGIFGSHVAHVLRRLRRVCEYYGASTHLLLRERDDRQSRRARVGVVRTAGRGDHRRRVAARGTRTRCAGNARCSTRTPVRAVRRTSKPQRCSPGSCARVIKRSRSRAAGAVPRWSRNTRGGGSPTPHPSSRTGSPRTAAGYLARGTPRARTQDLRRSLARHRGNERARARHRCRRPRRSDPQRVSGHARIDVATSRTRRAYGPALGGRPRRRRRPARPVVRGASHGAHDRARPNAPS